ncbi:hypothetical protein [Mixta tenebrionis]|uniref:hypothetical protein n=1 Tax=Mixta tenebrionis TaxID=2562439 RepID=UPI0011404843
MNPAQLLTGDVRHRPFLFCRIRQRLKQFSLAWLALRLLTRRARNRNFIINKYKIINMLFIGRGSGYQK